MKEYLTLQYNLLNRKMIEIGFSPIFGYGLAIITFYGVSVFLFSKTEYAEYFYGLTAISFLSRLNGKRRNDFLKTIFTVKDYKKLRIIENLIVIFPFVVFLLFTQSFLVVLVLISISILMSIFNFDNSFNYTIPTPFSKKPFEFSVGFRKTFYIFPFAYFLTLQSILVENFNLGIFSLILIAIVILSYYSKPENEFYIWSFNLSSKGFLMNKIKIGILYSTLLSLPVIAPLIIFFPDEATILLLFILLSYAYIITLILAKYSAYPNEMNLPEGILIGLSLMFPPILLAIIPMFYSKSIKQLKPILEND
jgi:hypothetical protein